MRRLGGRCAGGNLPRGRGSDKANVMKRGSCASEHQYACADASQRRREGEMAERTGIRRGVGVVMPDHSQCCPQNQHEKRYRDNHTPELFLVGHFLRGDAADRTAYQLV
jgi:hypothetical protein